MKEGTSILIGSIVYTIIGVLACVGFTAYVTKKTKNPHDVAENRKYLVPSR